MPLYEKIQREITFCDNFFLKTFCAGIISRAFSSFLIYPLLTIKTRIQQTQFEENCSIAKYTNIIQCYKKIRTLEGITGFYKGILPYLLKNGPSKGLFFVIYEFLKNKSFSYSN